MRRAPLRSSTLSESERCVADRLILRVGATLLAVVAAVAVSVVLGVWVPVITVSCAVVLAHGVTVPGPSGRSTSLAMGVMSAAVLLTGFDSAIAALAIVTGFPLGWWVLAISRGPRAADGIVFAEAAGGVAFLAVGTSIDAVIPHAEIVASWLHMLVMSCSAVVWFIVDAGVQARLPGSKRRISGRLRWLRALHDWPVALSVFSAGSMFAVTVAVMGPWAIVLAGLPYGFAHLAFLRLTRSRSTYAETITAMGAIPEAAGHAAPGRAARTSELAVAVAAECGLGAGAVDRVEQAALLHDIGTIVLANPAMVGGTFSPSDVAAWSAAIVGESPRLAPVAQLVLASPRPYRRPGEERDPDLPSGAHVVKVVAAFCLLEEEGLSSMDALERLHRGATYDYDPDVVHALRKVLVRRGAFDG